MITHVVCVIRKIEPYKYGGMNGANDPRITTLLYAQKHGIWPDQHPEYPSKMSPVPLRETSADFRPPLSKMEALRRHVACLSRKGYILSFKFQE